PGPPRCPRPRAQGRARSSADLSQAPEDGPAPRTVGARRAHPESPVALLVLLHVRFDRWTERRRMDQIMWRNSVRNDAVVTVIPVTGTELEHAATQLLMRAVAEGVRRHS